jgi:hypothetical protein
VYVFYLLKLKLCSALSAHSLYVYKHYILV